MFCSAPARAHTGNGIGAFPGEAGARPQLSASLPLVAWQLLGRPPLVGVGSPCLNGSAGGFQNETPAMMTDGGVPMHADTPVTSCNV